MSGLLKVFLSLVATFGFALNFKIRDRIQLLVASCSGGLGYAVFLLTAEFLRGDTLPTLFAALTVGLLGEFFSRKIKTPAHVIILPGIIPLVPGTRLFSTMLYFVQAEFLLATDQALQTAFIAGGIALGILLASLFSVSLRRMRRLNVIGRKERKKS